MHLMYYQIRSRVKYFIVLTRTDHLCIHNYIISLLRSILTPTTFNYILTAHTPLLMPLTDSPPVYSPYTNGLPPTL